MERPSVVEDAVEGLGIDRDETGVPVSVSEELLRVLSTAIEARVGAHVRDSARSSFMQVRTGAFESAC